MSFLKKYTGELLSLALGLILLVGFYGQSLKNLNQYLFSVQGDGLKNYYTYQHHIVNDSTYHHFEGMNYPYGEIVPFTDGQPILAWAVKFASEFSPLFSANAIAIMNLLMLLSFLITIFLVYKILKILGLPPIPGAFFSLGILMLAPQLYRFAGHFSLSYSFVLPLIFYLLLKKKQNPSIRFSIYLFAANTFQFFMHPYMAMMSIFLIVVYDGVTWIIEKHSAKKRIISFLLSVVLPLIIFQSYSIAVDQHVNRTNTPTGFYDNTSSWKTLLIPHAPYLDVPLKQVFNAYDQLWEGWCYLGIFSILLVFVLIAYRLFLWFHERKWRSGFFRSEENLLLFAGFLILLYSFGFPYIIGFDFLLDILPPLRQIRALARFSWVFYFAINFFAAVKIYKWLAASSLNNRKWALSLVLILTAGLNISEGWIYHVRTSRDIASTPNYFIHPTKHSDLKEILPKIKNPKKYQAIITLPFYFVGPEEYSIEPKEGDLATTMLISYHLKLPLVNTCLSRTSLTEAKKIIQSIGLPYFDKPLKNDLHSNKPILLFKRKTYLRDEENMLVNRAVKIDETSQFEIYEITIDNWLVNLAQVEIQEFLNKKDQLIKVGDFYLQNINDLLFFKNFEDNSGNSDRAFSGKKAFQGMKNDNNVYFMGNKDASWNPNEEYTVRYWYYANRPSALINMHIMEEVDKESGNAEWYASDCRNSLNLYQDWELISVDYKLKNMNANINILNKAYLEDDDSIFVDDFMIQKKNSVVYRISDGTLFKNNFPLGKVNVKTSGKAQTFKSLYFEDFTSFPSEQNKQGKFLLAPGSEYSPGLLLTGKEANGMQLGNQLIISAKVQTLSLKNKFSLVFSVEKNGQSVKYFSEEYVDQANGPIHQLSKKFPLPPIADDETIKVYVFSQNACSILLDELKVETGLGF